MVKQFKAIASEDPAAAAKALYLGLSLMFVIFCYSIVQPVRGALVATDMGSAALPVIWIWSSVATAIIVLVYGKLLDVVSKFTALSILTTFFATALLAVRLLMDRRIPALSGVFYVWGEVYSVIMVEHIWSMASDSFSTSTAKRCYGLINLGSVAGGLMGSALVVTATRALGAQNLIYACVCSLGLVLLCSWRLSRLSRAPLAHSAATATTLAPADDAGMLAGFRAIRGSRYLLTIAGLVLFNQVVSNLVNYQSNALVESAISGLDARTEIFGKMFLAINIICLVLSGGFTSVILQKLGVRATLLALPLGNIASALTSLVLPGAGAAACLRIVDKSLNYSLNRSSKEILYIPVPASSRAKAKAVIDVLVYRLSKLAGTALMIPVAQFVPVSRLGMVNIALLVPACLLVFAVGRTFENLEESVPASESQTYAEPSAAENGESQEYAPQYS